MFLLELIEFWIFWPVKQIRSYFWSFIVQAVWITILWTFLLSIVTYME